MRAKTSALLNLILGLDAIGAAFYIQYHLGQPPCDLCMLQRIIVFAMIIVSVFMLLLNARPIFIRCLSGVSALLAIAGAALAGRHLYLQSLPESLKPSCGPGWNYMIEHAPFLQALENMIRGSGECAQVQGLFLGYSLPFWTLLLFILMGIISILGLKK